MSLFNFNPTDANKRREFIDDLKKIASDGDSDGYIKQDGTPVIVKPENGVPEEAVKEREWFQKKWNPGYNFSADNNWARFWNAFDKGTFVFHDSDLKGESFWDFDTVWESDRKVLIGIKTEILESRITKIVQEVASEKKQYNAVDALNGPLRNYIKEKKPSSEDLARIIPFDKNPTEVYELLLKLAISNPDLKDKIYEFLNFKKDDLSNVWLGNSFLETIKSSYPEDVFLKTLQFLLDQQKLALSSEAISALISNLVGSYKSDKKDLIIPILIALGKISDGPGQVEVILALRKIVPGLSDSVQVGTRKIVFSEIYKSGLTEMDKMEEAFNNLLHPSPPLSESKTGKNPVIVTPKMLKDFQLRKKAIDSVYDGEDRQAGSRNERDPYNKQEYSNFFDGIFKNLQALQRESGTEKVSHLYVQISDQVRTITWDLLPAKNQALLSEMIQLAFESYAQKSVEWIKRESDLAKFKTEVEGYLDYRSQVLRLGTGSIADAPTRELYKQARVRDAGAARAIVREYVDPATGKPTLSYDKYKDQRGLYERRIPAVPQDSGDAMDSALRGWIRR